MESGISETTKETIAFFLPQFYPTTENDTWWGPGFTEWFNVVRARPLFDGHLQPRLPHQLGFYDLRVQETRTQQWELANSAGITAFLYWWYSFGDDRSVLRRPTDDLRRQPDLKHRYCLGWANETWTGIWHGEPDRVLIEQRYDASTRWDRQFGELLEHFMDPRYVLIDGRPLFYLYRPDDLPDLSAWCTALRKFLKLAGFPDVYLVGEAKGDWCNDARADCFDAAAWAPAPPLEADIGRDLGMTPLGEGPTRYVHDDSLDEFISHGRSMSLKRHPCLRPGFDNTPRLGERGVVTLGSTPERLSRSVEIALAAGHTDPRILFVASWNEWAEGAILEPCSLFGRGMLRRFADAIGGGAR